MTGEDHIAIPPGTIVLDKYRVERPLGIGGMGVVVMATHIALGTPVAIKFLLPQFAASPEASRRFVREAQAASKIASEHIVRVFDTGTTAPHGPYIVMEFLEGNDLSNLVRRGGVLAIDVAIDYVVQAALALAEAHANGVVHRDVKPANLFLVEQPDGSPLVKVLDFGISKVAEGASLEVTKTSAILGSGLYMSPEQMKASKSVDHRTDVYALGISLFELLTRTQPFTADSFAELAIKVNMEPPANIRSFRQDVPPELAEVIAKAYAKKPEDRYQSMGELALALAPWAAERTQRNIDRLARTETRRGRAPSLPPPRTGSSPSLAPLSPSFLEGDLKIPPPPSLPSPSSVGVDTFGLSKKNRGVDPNARTAAQTFSEGRARSGVGAMLGVGVFVGVAGAAALGYFLLRKPPAPVTSELAAELSASGARSAQLGPTISTTEAAVTSADVAIPSATSRTTASKPTSSSSPSARASAQAASAAPVASADVPTASPTATAAATTAVPVTGPAPCKLRDLNGNLVDCDKPN